MDANNETVRFQRGFSAVICRSKDQEAGGVSIKRSLELEEEYFASAQCPLKGINKDQVGVKSLNKKLTKMLATSIQESLADIESRLKTERFRVEKSLKYDYPKELSDKGRLLEVHDCITRFTQIYESLMTGMYATESHMVIPGIIPGAMGEHSKTINKWLYHEEMNLVPSRDWDPTKTMRKVKTMGGDGMACTFSDKAFELLMRAEFVKLPEPSEKYLQRKESLLKNICKMTLDHVCAKYPSLRDRMVELANKTIAN